MWPPKRLWRDGEAPQGGSQGNALYYSQNWMMDGPAIYREYMTDPGILICPSDSDGRRPGISGSGGIFPRHGT